MVHSVDYPLDGGKLLRVEGQIRYDSQAMRSAYRALVGVHRQQCCGERAKHCPCTVQGPGRKGDRVSRIHGIIV